MEYLFGIQNGLHGVAIAVANPFPSEVLWFLNFSTTQFTTCLIKCYLLRPKKTVLLENFRHITPILRKTNLVTPITLAIVIGRIYVVYYLVFWILNKCICIGTRKVESR